MICSQNSWQTLAKVQEERYFAKFRYGNKLYNNFDVPYIKRFNVNACVKVCIPVKFEDSSKNDEKQTEEEEPKKPQNTTRSSSGRKVTSPTHLSDYELGEGPKKEPAKSSKGAKKPAPKRPKSETSEVAPAKKRRCAKKEEDEEDYKPNSTKKSNKDKKQARGKSTYKNYSPEDIMNAVKEVSSGGKKVDEVAKQFGIPCRTIYDKMKKLGLKPPKKISKSEEPSKATNEEEANKTNEEEGNKTNEEEAKAN